MTGQTAENTTGVRLVDDHSLDRLESFEETVAISSEHTAGIDKLLTVLRGKAQEFFCETTNTPDRKPSADPCRKVGFGGGHGTDPDGADVGDSGRTPENREAREFSNFIFKSFLGAVFDKTNERFINGEHTVVICEFLQQNSRIRGRDQQ